MIEYALLIGPVLFIAVTIMLGKITPNYNWKIDYISELSLKKYGWIQKLNFIICGLSITAISILLATQTDNLVIKLAWYMGAVLGIPTALAGVWDTDVKMDLRTKAGKLHDWTYHIGIVGTGLAYLLMGWGYRDNPIITIFSWSIAVFDLLWWLYAQKLGIKPGVGQRIVIFSAIAWVVVMAVRSFSR